MICYVVRKDSVANKLSANINCKVTYLKSHTFITLSNKLSQGRAVSTLRLEHAFGAQSIARWTSGNKVEGSKPAVCLFYSKSFIIWFILQFIIWFILHIHCQLETQ
jgi:hypothetical protein